EPACNFDQIESLKLVRIEAGDTNTSALRAPDSQVRRRHEKRSAISIQGKARLVWFLLQAEGDQIAQRPLAAVMGPGETLAGSRIESRKSFPVPGRRPDGLLKSIFQTRSADLRHQITWPWARRGA